MSKAIENALLSLRVKKLSFALGIAGLPPDILTIKCLLSAASFAAKLDEISLEDLHKTLDEEYAFFNEDSPVGDSVS